MKRPAQIKAALVYASGHRDFHIGEIKRACRISKGRYEDVEALAILREVKDVAPFELWAVYERPGWWTTNPSHEVRLVALFRSAERNATEQSRSAQVLRRHRRADSLTGVARLAAKQTVGVKELFEDDLPDPERSDDHCLRRIDRLMQAE